MTRRLLRFLSPTLALLFVFTCSPTLLAQDTEQSAEAETSPEPQIVVIPEDDSGAKALEARAEAQIEAARSWKVFHDFGFEDRLDATGIGFRHRVVSEAAKHFKPAHYDHGNGVAVADVDGDGWYDLYFVNQVGANELWRNRGDGTFEDWTERAGVALEDRISVTASFGDLDNDGDPDLYVTTVRYGNALFENLGAGKFKDVTAQAGLTHSGHSSGAVLFDYDLDGLLDIFLVNVGVYTRDGKADDGAYIAYVNAFQGHLVDSRTETSILYENQGGLKFRDVSKERSLVDGSWSGDATFADLSGDEYPDLYIVNMQGDDHYYENQGGKRFVDRTADFFPKTPWGAMGVGFFDWNNDGLQDLLLTDMHSDMSYLQKTEEEKLKSRMDPDQPALEGGRNNVFGNAFYENRGDGEFVEISDRVGAENYWPWGFSVGDLNADGFEDVFIASSMNYPFHYGINTVLLNEGGERFRDSEFVLGVEPRKGGKTKIPYFELDCDGDDKGHIRCPEGADHVMVHANTGTRSSAIFDFDRDGDLDVVTAEFNDVPQVLVSNLAETATVNWLEIVLEGTRSNRDGLGAVVRVKTGDRVQTRSYSGKSGYLTQSSWPLYFGLGSKESVDSVEVVWPSGVRQTITEGIPVRDRMQIVEPEPEPESPTR